MPAIEILSPQFSPSSQDPACPPVDSPAQAPKRLTQTSAVIYREYPRKIGNKIRIYSLLEYRLNGKRKQEWRSTPAKRNARIKELDLQISNGQINAVSFSEAQRNSHLRCQELAHPTGKPPELCIASWADIEKRSRAAGATIEQIIECGLRNFSMAIVPKPIAELVPKFLLDKKHDGISDHYLRGLTTILERFAGHFQIQIDQLQSGAINDWLRPFSPETRYHYRAAVGQFITWCKAHNHLQKTWSEMDHVPVPNRKAVEFEIGSNDQAARLLDAAGDKLEAFIALGLFAGIRHEEIQKLDWSDINLKKGTIYIRKGIAKTGRDRIIPISPNLRTWLEPHARASGTVCRVANTSNALWRAKARAGIPNKRDQTQNMLRKMYISNRLSVVKDIAQVALEAGNSPQKIKDNYNRVPDPEDAKAYFQIIRKTGKQPNLPGLD